MSNTMAEELMSAAISTYRLIPALKVLIDGDTILKGHENEKYLKCSAYRGVLDWLSIVCGDRVACANILQEFLHRNKEWIRYAYADMCQYNELLGGYTHIASTHYMPRMLEEAKYYNWNLDAFQISEFEEFSLIDIGCGPFSHFHSFRSSNPSTLKRYCGIDKRDMGVYALKLDEQCRDEERAKCDNDCEVAFMKCDVAVDRDKLIDIGLDCEVLFFGEMLHCVAEPMKVFAWCVDAMESLQIVKILEPKCDGAGLDICFDFHMMSHSPGRALDSDTVMHMAGIFGWHLSMMEASSQHVMYTLTRG